MLLGVVMSKNMVLPRILHILDYEKQGFCAYIPPFGGGIEDFVCINLDNCSRSIIERYSGTEIGFFTRLGRF